MAFIASEHAAIGGGLQKKKRPARRREPLELE